MNNNQESDRKLLDTNIEADRMLQADLMASMKLVDKTICNTCGEEGIILKAKNSDVEACWVCVKNNKVTNPTGEGFFPEDPDDLEKML